MPQKPGRIITGPPLPDAPGPRRSVLPWLEVVRPEWPKPVLATLISLRWRCLDIHWIPEESRSTPCIGAGCTLCPKIGSHWYAWAVALTHGTKRVCIVEVTEKGWEWGPPALCDQDATVRGLGISLTRKNKSRTAGIVVKSIPPEYPTSQLPPPMDPKPFLLRMWGYVETDGPNAPS